MESNDNVFPLKNDSLETPPRKFNRKELRKMQRKYNASRANAPRNIASRKVLPMPDGWEGWKNWKPKKRAV